jgi:hypothetical protein
MCNSKELKKSLHYSSSCSLIESHRRQEKLITLIFTEVQGKNPLQHQELKPYVDISAAGTLGANVPTKTR